MSFLGGIFTGSNPTLNDSINNATGIEGFGTSVGEGDINAASGFDQTLLSGDQAEEAKLLAPQIQTQAQQAQQKNQTNAEFGDRSGGTNASNQQTNDTARSNISNMIAQLTGQAATNTGNLGTSTLGLGLGANQTAAQEAEQKQQEQQQSLLGGLLTGGIGDLLESASSFLPTGG